MNGDAGSWLDMTLGHGPIRTSWLGDVGSGTGSLQRVPIALQALLSASEVGEGVGVLQCDLSPKPYQAGCLPLIMSLTRGAHDDTLRVFGKARGFRLAYKPGWLLLGNGSLTVVGNVLESPDSFARGPRIVPMGTGLLA